ncbi:hypothetical protein RJ639_026753 [Escallonia herrerae]|uniref:Protein LURP-one-related 6 n=1 Tax=Escallonia herrerae TaxID=1293975 RepID=A0AA89BGQ0_9ASTE|nr:hypothetical protein RJ639_026753 [Escallonia herrerae]
MAGNANMMPIISKMFCSSSQVVLVVRRRPHMVSGGGFVVTDCSQRVVFRVDGCGVLGKKEELILSEGDGEPLLLIRRKEGLVEALSINRQWKGYSFNYEGSRKLVFSLKEPKACFAKKHPIRISVDQKEYSNSEDFEIKGHFPDRKCSIVNSRGDIIAQVGVMKEVEQLMASKDLYYVAVTPGIDQAFVFGVIAILDYIFDGSTRC